MSLENEQDVLFKSLVESRGGRRAVKALGRIPRSEAAQIAFSVIAEVSKEHGSRENMGVIHVDSVYYRIDVRQIDEKDVPAAVQEGIELRKKEKVGIDTIGSDTHRPDTPSGTQRRPSWKNTDTYSLNQHGRNVRGRCVAWRPT